MIKLLNDKVVFDKSGFCDKVYQTQKIVRAHPAFSTQEQIITVKNRYGENSLR